MTKKEELLIDAHIWKRKEFAFITLWGVLEKDKTFYNNSLEGLIQYGNVLCKIVGKDDVVGLTKILNHLGLNFEFVASGLKLMENSKLDYRENVMNKKASFVDYGYEKKFNRIVKDEPEDDKIGWSDRKLKK
ncbi:hypothetical protein CFS9_02860 [Flavobacterium sp. CFS9]|uniref:Uncharacterized protein n=1 Tax=Flavobacterium sp. CFS9 TaxID=3143118 RepID=A0AAT9GWP8_9FLAO